MLASGGEVRNSRWHGVNSSHDGVDAGPFGAPVGKYRLAARIDKERGTALGIRLHGRGPPAPPLFWNAKMSIRMALLPLFVQVALTLGLLLWLAVLRRNDITSGATHPSRIALREPNWPPRTQQVAYAFSNQFELPVLFYVLTILEIVTRQADYIFVVLAWIFVLTRIAHAYVHTTSNVVLRRGGLYAVGAIALIVMWIIFMLRILLPLP
jgi:hypothetical protein